MYSLRLIRIFSAGAAVAFSTFAFIYLAVYAYVISYPAFGGGEVGPEQLENLVGFVGGWGARAFFLVAVVLAASWVARAAGENAIWHGVLTGLVATIAGQTIIYFLYPPVETFELSVYLAFGMIGGILGGFEGKRSLTGEEALYRASRQISTAQDPEDILAAIGEQLGGAGAKNLLLWRFVPEAPDDLESEPWAFWTSLQGKKKRNKYQAKTFETPVFEEPSNLQPRTLKPEDLTAAERSDWKRRGVRSAFVIPLAAPGEVRVGLLVVEFRTRRRLPRREIREYLTIGAQAALALKNLQLVEAARETGERAGVLLERQRLSHEIHDTLAQGFTSILMSLTAWELANPSSSTNDPFHRHLEEARRSAQENLAEARRLVWALRPEPLERYSLPKALRNLVEEWSKQSDIEAETIIIGPKELLRSETEISMFRIAQEALTNVRRHAQANRITLTLSYTEDSVMLNVQDDGIGFDTVETFGRDRPGFGFVAMRERAEQLGGSFSVESEPGKGTALTVVLPGNTEKESGEENKIQEKTR